MSKPGQRVRFDLSLIVSHYQVNAIVLLDITCYTCTVNTTDPSIHLWYSGAEMKTGTTHLVSSIVRIHSALRWWFCATAAQKMAKQAGNGIVCVKQICCRVCWQGVQH